MRKEMMDMIQENKDLHNFLHESPIWYRKLGRNPHEIENFQRVMRRHYKKTLPDKMERWKNQLDMAKLFLEMLKD